MVTRLDIVFEIELDYPSTRLRDTVVSCQKWERAMIDGLKLRVALIVSLALLATLGCTAGSDEAVGSLSAGVG